jgi:hypothetical protein
MVRRKLGWADANTDRVVSMLITCFAGSPCKASGYADQRYRSAELEQETAINAHGGNMSEPSVGINMVPRRRAPCFWAV